MRPRGRTPARPKSPGGVTAGGIAGGSAGSLAAAATALLLAPLPAVAVQADRDPALLAGSAAVNRSGPVFFDYELLAFGASEGRTEAIVSVSVDGSRLTPSVRSGGWGYGAVAVLELRRAGRTEAIATALAALDCTGRLGSAHGVPLYLTALIEPGVYDYRLDVSDAHRSRGNPTSRSEGRLVVPRLDGPGPVLTSLAVATDSVRQPWSRAPRGLRVNPTHLVSDDAPPLIYFEIHGVQPGAPVWTDLTFEPLAEPGALDRLLRGGRRPYTIRYRDRAPADPDLPIRSTLRVELASLRPGPYSVRVVAELDGGARSLPMTSTLELVDGRRSGYSAVTCEDVPGALHEAPPRLDGDTAQR